MLQVFNYNAGRGDCIRLRYAGISGVLHNILIDSGVSRFGLEFEFICQKIISDHEKIDAVLITHVDLDHLGGLLYNLRNKTTMCIEEVWMNHGRLMRKNTDLAVKHNDDLYTRLNEQNIPVKAATTGTTYELDGAVFKMLWPNKEILRNLFGESSSDVLLKKHSDYGYSLDELMEMPIKRRDTSLSNRASVIMEVSYKGQKILFTGDGWAEDILQVVENKTYDLIKLPHHGSIRNISEEWCGQIMCKNYIICTDGISHPDKQTIAKLLKWNDEITVYGSTDWWKRMLIAGDEEKLEKIHFVRGEYLWKLSDGE